jgi:cytochrome c553
VKNIKPEILRPRGRGFGAVAILFGLPLALFGSSYLIQSSAKVQIPSNVVWDAATIAAATSGDPLRGLLIAKRCDHCHGSEGFSSNPTVPNLAAMDQFTVWKQLADFRAGKRSSSVMEEIARQLSPQNTADVAAYYSMLPNVADPLDERSFPQPSQHPNEVVVAARLIALGDGARGIPPCQACHGRVGYIRGATSLATQNGTYILNQLRAFADGLRANDINKLMRTIANQLTDTEKQALADYYGAGLGLYPAGATITK